MSRPGASSHQEPTRNRPRTTLFKLLARVTPHTSLEERLARLEGFRSAFEITVAVALAFVGLLAGGVVYNAFQSRMEAEVARSVSQHAAAYRDSIEQHATAVAESKTEVILLATSIAARVSPTSTPFPSTEAALQTVKEFYALINSQSHLAATALLTPDFKYRTGQDNFDNFIKQWEAVDSVAIVELVLTARSELSATYTARLTYRYKSGQSPRDFVYSYRLAYDSYLAKWLIDSIRPA